jgi:hypothetical protein
MPAASPLTAGRVRRVMAVLISAGAIGAAVLGCAHASASPSPKVPTAVLASSVHAGGDIPAHFVGLSLEWSLVERYMGPKARPVFANLMSNLGTGVLRIGGSSQDLLPFDPTAADSNRVITPNDLAAVRATLDTANAGDAPAGAPSWGAILGTAMAPRTPARSWAGPDHARRFTEAVTQAFSGAAARDVAGIELGNEPDVSYRADADRYERDFAGFSGATAPFAIVAPNTSEVIARWTRVDANQVHARSWDWPRLLAAIAPAMRARAGAFGHFATGHFYPLARKCSRDQYRCATIGRLLSDERMANLRYAIYAHAREAARLGLPYRVEELNSAANRGVHGVSDTAASALWAIDAMFNAACPRPPEAPAANQDCGTGAIGVNFHDAEVRAFSHPGEGNAYYNPIAYDPTAAMGAPTAAPEYYGLLLFARLAQRTHGLRPVAVSSSVSAWSVDADSSERRLFLINKGDRAVRLNVAAPGASYAIDRMTPHDPTGKGRVLDAPEVRIDGREVAADGTWPGFQPQAGAVAGGRLEVTLRAGEAAVVRLAE